MQTVTPFAIDTRDPGSPRVEIDGVDVTASVSRLFVEVDTTVPLPVVTIQTALPGRIAGLGHVNVVHAPSGAEVADMIASLDPADLKREALGAMPQLGQDTTAALVAVIARKVAEMIDELDR
jgi:hypothetical protein